MKIRDDERWHKKIPWLVQPFIFFCWRIYGDSPTTTRWRFYKWLLRSCIFSGGPCFLGSMSSWFVWGIATYVIHGSTGYSFVCSRSKSVDRCAVFWAWGVSGNRRPDIVGDHTHVACLLLPFVIFLHCSSSTSRWITVSCTFWIMLKISTSVSSRSSFQSLILITYNCTEYMWWLWLRRTVLYCTLINYVYHPTLEQ